MTGTVTLSPNLTLRLDRCVIEATFTRFGLPFARARFRATEGALSLPTVLDIRVASIPVRANPIIRWKWGRRPRGLEFRSSRIDRVDGERLRIVGVLENRGKEHALTLDARIVHADGECVVLAARGAVHGIRIELAGEFT